MKRATQSPRATRPDTDLSTWSVRKLKQYLQARQVSTDQFAEKHELIQACAQFTQAHGVELMDLIRLTPAAKLPGILSSELLARTPAVQSLADLPVVPTKVCGKVFKDGDLAYNCLTCQSDGTCVQCQQCFNQSNHEGHLGITFHRTGSGGTCDCGDFESWNVEGCCPTHQQSVQADPASSLSQEMFTAGSELFAACVKFLQVVCETEAQSFHHALESSKSEAEDGELASVVHVLVHNDDYHSYEDVNECLEPILGRGHGVRSLPEVTQIDKFGRAEIFQTSNGYAAAREQLMGSKIRQHRLIVSFALQSQLDLERNAVAVVTWVQSICKQSPALARVFVQQLIQPPPSSSNTSTLRLFREWAEESGFAHPQLHAEDTEAKASLLDVICRISAILPKVLILQLRELFLHLIYDDLFKCEISSSVGECLPQLAVACARGLGVEEDSLLQMSFHFFTSKQIARNFYERHPNLPLLSPIVTAVSRFLHETDLAHRSIMNRKNRLFFQAFRYQANLGLLGDLNTVNQVLGLVKSFQVDILNVLHFLDPHRRRQEPTHVEFESETWHVAFDLTMEAFLNLIHPMVCAILSCNVNVVQLVVQQVITLLQEKCPHQPLTTSREIYLGTRQVSFHLPLHRFACDLLLGAVRKFPDFAVPLDQITTNLAFVDFPLRLYIATCQMAHNQWVRDGQVVFIEQSYYRMGARFCFHDLDVKLLAVATRACPQFLLTNMKLCFVGRGEEVMVEEYLKLCAALFHSLPVADETAMLEVALVHTLAASPNAAMPLTDIIQSLQSRKAMMDSFEDQEEDIPSELVVELLKKVAVMTLDKNRERKFGLKPEVLMHQVDANSWFLSQNEREHVNDLREQKLASFSELESMPLCPSAPLDCLPWFTPVRDTITSDEFLHQHLGPILVNAVKGNQQLYKSGVRTLRTMVQGETLTFCWTEEEFQSASSIVSPNLVKIALYLLTLAVRHRGPEGVDCQSLVGGDLSLLECLVALRSCSSNNGAGDLESLGVEWLLRQFALTNREIDAFVSQSSSSRAKPTSSAATTTTGKVKKVSSKKRKATEAQHSILERMRLAQQKTASLFEEEQAAAAAANGVEEATRPTSSSPSLPFPNNAPAHSEHMCSLCRSSGDVKELGYFAYYHESVWWETEAAGATHKPEERVVLSNPHGKPPQGWDPPATVPVFASTAAPTPPVATPVTTASETLDWGMVSSATNALLMSHEGLDLDGGDDDDVEEEILTDDEDEFAQIILNAMDPQQIQGLGFELGDVAAAAGSSSDEEEEANTQQLMRTPSPSSVTQHGKLPIRLHVRSCGHVVHVSCLREYQNSSARNPLMFHSFSQAEYACSMCKATSNCILLLPKRSASSLSESHSLFAQSFAPPTTSNELPPTKLAGDIAKKILRKLCNDVSDEYELFAAAARTIAFTWTIECNAKLRIGTDAAAQDHLLRDAQKYSNEHLALFETLSQACGKCGLDEWRLLIETGKTQSRICNEEEVTYISEFDPLTLFVILAMLHWDELSRGNLVSMAKIALGVFKLQAASFRTLQDRQALVLKLAFCFKVFRPNEDVPFEEFAETMPLPQWAVPLRSSAMSSLAALMPQPLGSHFVILPSKYDELYSQVMQNYMCPTKKHFSREVALCLMCGECVCAGAACCSRKRSSGTPHGAATLHALQTCAGLGVFLMLQRCQILLIHGKRAMFLPAPYLDSDGYPDPNLSRGKPLQLDEERYLALQRLVADHQVPNEVMRNRGELQRHVISAAHTTYPSKRPTKYPSRRPSKFPTKYPSKRPSNFPTKYPSNADRPGTIAPSGTAPARTQTTTTGFNISVSFTGTVNFTIQEAFTAAAIRWQQVLPVGFATKVLLPRGTYCGVTVEQPTIIQDLLIQAQIQPIDGLYGVLGAASPCLADTLGQIRFGVMEFDSADVALMLASGTFNNVVLHEMGHVLGIGSLWSLENLVGAIPLAPTGGYPYLGSDGNEGNVLVGLTGDAVVENLGGDGTARVHWKETVYDSELMTGYVEDQDVAMPLSKLTVLALQDLGYTVNVSNADPYMAPGALTNSLRREGGVDDEVKNKTRLHGCLSRRHNLTIIESTTVKPGREQQLEDDSNRLAAIQRRKRK
ncbi:hypothetical protein BASA81_012903 [Batrachochytrium salamandrivorans]|nr:hypothetical protein BASA81_012903 [Batrachochytrium salamandrivorans]